MCWKKVTGKKRDSKADAEQLKAQGNLLDTWAAIGDDAEQMGQYLMTPEMVGMLNTFGKEARVLGSAAFAEESGDISAKWTVADNNTVSLLDNLALVAGSSKIESKLMEKFDKFFDALENKVKFATVDGLVDFPKFSRADMEIKSELLTGVQAATDAANLGTVTAKGADYTKLVKPVLKAWQDTATNAIKAIQKLAADEKAKGKTLFLPELVAANGAALTTPRTGTVTSWGEGSTTAGIKGAAAGDGSGNGNGGFMLKLVSVKPGEKRAFLKMDTLVAPTADISGTTITAKDVVTDNGVKLLKKMSDFYKKAKGKRAPFNPAAWQQKISSFNVAEQKIIDAYNAELAKKASGPDFTKAQTKLENMLNRKTADSLSFTALGGKFARVAQEDSEGL